MSKRRAQATESASEADKPPPSEGSTPRSYILYTIDISTATSFAVTGCPSSSCSTSTRFSAPLSSRTLLNG